MIASVLLPPPPPRDDLNSTCGAGASEDSGPVQSTTLPSEYGWRTLNEYVFDASADARNWKTASSSEGALPPDQVTCWTWVSSPDPVDFTLRVQPDDGANESIAKPLGGVSSTLAVLALSFSVGTASVKNWP